MKHTKETALGLLFALSAAVSGCGQQPFVASSAIESQRAPGNFTIPAKVDFLLVEDDTGSMNEIYPQIAGAMPGVLAKLEANKAWDYHFATIPLTTYRSLNQVTASHYDGNWGVEWQIPFPGATQYGPGTVTPNYFYKTYEYNAYLHPNEINNTNGQEQAFKAMLNSLTTMKNDSLQGRGSNFLRDDAMLVILVVGNGNDTSGVNFCYPYGPDQFAVPCDEVYGAVQCDPNDMSKWGAPGQTCASGALSLNYYQNAIASIKNSPAMVRFYSAVSGRVVTNLSCQRANASIGSRYQAMASAFKGRSYDICSGPSAVTAALDQLASDLTGTRLTLQTRYLPIAQRPEPSTIVVTRNDGVIIPQNAINGWTYTDAPYNGAYAIDKPVPMNRFSGYAIELHGNYKLIGDQSADVSYTPYGLQNSH